MKKIIALSLVAFLSTALSAATDADTQAQIDALSKEIKTLKKDQKRTKKTLNKVKAHDAYDNIKFGIDFRNAVDVLDYKNNVLDANGNATGQTLRAKNDALATSRLYLTMKSSPMDGLVFLGKLAVYSTWGSHLYVDDSPLKDWAASSKPSDTVMRIKEAYFVYSNSIGEQPWSISIGRRPSTNGFLISDRNADTPEGSPLAHITNMEVNAMMIKLDWDRFLSGAYTKFVYGRAHTGDMENVYGTGTTPWSGPYANKNKGIGYDKEDENVDFFVLLGDAYNNGQHHLMYQWAHIFNTKGKSNTQTYPLNGKPVIKGDAGTAELLALSYKMEGIGDEISDFLDETTFFLSGAYTQYDAKSGHSLLGSTDGGSQDGSSVWTGIIIPDMITEAGKFGIEYNHGSQYWTPMTWAEDSAMGSKVAVRGDAYEAYWNFNLFGVKYLPSQVRYTYAQHDYTPNLNCAGWVKPVKVDIQAQDLRFAVSYRY